MPNKQYKKYLSLEHKITESSTFKDLDECESSVCKSFNEGKITHFQLCNLINHVRNRRYLKEAYQNGDIDPVDYIDILGVTFFEDREE